MERFSTPPFLTLASSESLGLAAQPLAAEAGGTDVLVAEAMPVEQGAAQALPEGSHDSAHQGGAAGASPLVTVIVRSMDRGVLHDALRSIATQTWPNVEVLVVNAKGGEHSPLPTTDFPFPMSLVGSGLPLPRAAAANAGLRAARGRFVAFLDDDDFLLSDHLTKLCNALMEGPGRAAYSGVRMVDADGNAMALFDEGWTSARLRGANFLPIHGVVFDRSLVEEGCSFDEELDCLEDWDFWQQVAERTEFRHVPGVSAVYRYGLGQSALSGSANMELHLATRARIFEKWSKRYSPRQWVESIFWFEYSLGQARGRAEGAEAESSRLGRELETVKETLDATSEELSDLGVRHAETERALSRAQRALKAAERRIAHLDHAYALERGRTQALLSSTSWKLGAPLRLFVRLARGERREVAAALRRRVLGLGRRAFHRVPGPMRGAALETAYRLGGWLFRGTSHYETWRRKRADEGVSLAEAAAPTTMVSMGEVEPYRGREPGSIAIHMHVFYADLAGEFAAYLGNMPFPFDLFVSVPNEEVRDTCRKAFADIPRCGKAEIAVVPNRGRDIAPMICTFGAALRRYDFVAHFHTKKSLYNNGATDGWRQYLLQALLGGEETVRRVFTLLGRHSMVFPQSFHAVPYMASTWLANRHHGTALSARMGLAHVPSGYFDFPVGSMFWARGETLRPLFECDIILEEFPEEAGQTDGTLAHGIERVLGVLALNRGENGAAVIRDVQWPSWSAWRLDQYLGRPRRAVEDAVRGPDTPLVIFDVFDTLLVRPLLDPEDVKKIVARRVGELGSAYLQWRAVAEGAARQRAGRDVGLDEIFGELSTLAGWDEATAERVCRIEIEVEKASVRVRSEGFGLMKLALEAGRRVVLASDTYLPRAVVAEMLAEAGVAGWHELYVSCEVGERKDTGALYSLILEREGVSPHEALMVGDNERSDLQLPCDMGLRFLHLLRAVELARALPRLSRLVDGQKASELDWSLALGMVVRRRFAPLFFEGFDPASLLGKADAAMLGYSVVGPLALSFAQWLLRQAKADGVEKLYFLAREGQFLKTVYDRLARDVPDAPESAYLVVSRRAVNLPAIRVRTDIHELAMTNFGPASLELFLDERFGLTLSEEDDALLRKRKLLPALSEVEVKDGDIADLVPLLDVLERRIFEVADGERVGTNAYLAQMGLQDGGRHAVVDIGYAGTIQKRLIRVLGMPVDGYYMITNQRVEELETEQGVRALGCFIHRAGAGGEGLPPALTESFVAEKLLSSDDPQVVNYRLDEGGVPRPTFKPLSREELATAGARRAVRDGAMEYVEEALRLAKAFGIEFTVPTELGLQLFEALVTRTSDAERQVLAGFSLDDHFCGRGVVS